MKKFFSMVIVFSLLISLFTVPTSAARFTNIADSLNQLGLFLGTNDGYELNAEATRVQAGIMLIRLLGQEKAALACEYSHPFVDVPEWAEKYVAYLYENKLTKGISETEFGTDYVCNIEMYTTFVLRALGYDDNAGDFQYIKSVAFGKQIGVVDSFIEDGAFYRDNMVAISYLALKAKPKGEKTTTLLHKLVADGAVAPASAQRVLQHFALYDEYVAATAVFNKAQRLEIFMTILAQMQIEDERMTFGTDIDMKIINENGKLSFVAKTSMIVFGEPLNAEIYYKDNYVYINVNGEKLKMKLEMDSIIDESDEPTPIYMIRSIQKSYKNNETIYSIDSSPLFGHINSLFDELEADFEIIGRELRTDTIIDKNGKVSEITVHMGFDMRTVYDDETDSVSCNFTITMNILKIGNDVKISFPTDLKNYIEL